VTFKKKLEFANFTCRFGQNLTLLDLFEELVWPSFKERKYVKRYRDTELFFLNTQLIKVQAEREETLLCLSGRLVKNTRLKRDQVFKETEGIVDDHRELRTSPSSIFVLILNNHRLVFAKEVSGAPDISTLQSACLRFLKMRRDAYIAELEEKIGTSLQDADVPREKKLRQSLLEKYPSPDLRITPLTDRQDLREFIRRFETIKHLRIKLLRTNQEDIDNDDFWRALSHSGERMDSRSTGVEFSNPRGGLESEEVFAQCDSATTLGNSTFKLRGIDTSSDRLDGNNEQFVLTVEEEGLSRDIRNATLQSVERFSELADEGVITRPTRVDRVVEKISEIIGRLNDEIQF
jgi:hypothetical protein